MQRSVATTRCGEVEKEEGEEEYRGRKWYVFEVRWAGENERSGKGRWRSSSARHDRAAEAPLHVNVMALQLQQSKGRVHILPSDAILADTTGAGRSVRGSAMISPSQASGVKKVKLEQKAQTYAARQPKQPKEGA